MIAMAEQPRNASPWQVAKAVFWSFLGIRRRAQHEQDVARIKPAHVIVAGIIMALIVGPSVLPVLVGGAEPTPEEVMSMLLPMLLAVLVILAVSLPVSMASRSPTTDRPRHRRPLAATTSRRR